MKMVPPITHILTNDVTALIRKMRELDSAELPQRGNGLTIKHRALAALLVHPEVLQVRRLGKFGRIRVTTCVRAYDVRVGSTSADLNYVLFTDAVEEDEPAPAPSKKITDFNDPDIRR